MRNTREMDAFPKATVSPVALLAAAVVLAQLHGRRFARYFLEDFGIDQNVISELLHELHTGNH
jgi:hypothetical protein